VSALPSGVRRILAAALAAGLALLAPVEAASAATTSPESIPLAPGPYPAKCHNGYVGLSFDDGPTTLTPKYLTTLQRYGAKAYFFDIGAQVAKFPGYARLELADGMWIGNHTMDHPRMAPLTYEQQYAELDQAQTVIAQATGVRPVLWRPPYDSINWSAAQAGYDQGLTWVSWTTDSLDYSGAKPTQIQANALAVPPGGVILLHDGLSTTLKALPGILTGLAARGLCPGKIVPSTVPTITSWDETYYAMVLP